MTNPWILLSFSSFYSVPFLLLELFFVMLFFPSIIPVQSEDLHEKPSLIPSGRLVLFHPPTGAQASSTVAFSLLSGSLLFLLCWTLSSREQEHYLPSPLTVF